ncbi:MAG: gliding motility-associated C-terminal domain-containing protein, partial [Bacteroidota bacterium]
GQWRLQVQDQNQCLKDTLFEILSPPRLLVKVDEVQSSSCSQANGLISLAVEGGSRPYQFQWRHTSENTPFLEDLIGGDPALVYAVRVIDQLGCEVSTDIPLENIEPSSVEIIPPFDPSVVQIYSSAGYRFFTQAANAVAYEWEVDGALAGVDAALTHYFADPGPHRIILTAFDASLSCPSRDTLEFTLVHRGQVIFPNAFTPNGDGRNDRFKPGIIGATYFEMTIYDRWGKLLMVERHAESGWDGNLPSGAPAPEGVYAYRAVIRYNDGREEIHGGSITLLR